MKTVFLALCATAFGMVANTVLLHRRQRIFLSVQLISVAETFTLEHHRHLVLLLRFPTSLIVTKLVYKMAWPTKSWTTRALSCLQHYHPRSSYDSTDSTALADMTRKMTIDAKLSGAFDIVRGTTLKVSYSTEVTSEHGGSLLDLAISQFLPIGGQPVIFSVGTKRHDSKRAHYKYGVKDTEARASRAAYAPGATNLTYPICEYILRSITYCQRICKCDRQLLTE